MALHRNNITLSTTGTLLCVAGALLFHCMSVDTTPTAVLTGSLQGWVVNTLSNGPLPNAEILLVGDSAMTRTDADGVFVLSGIPSGTQMLIVRRSRFISQTGAVMVQAGALSATDTIHLSADYGILSGVLLDSISGNPVTDAAVVLTGTLETKAVCSTTTGHDGIFVFDTIGSADSGYRMTFTRQGYQERSLLQKIDPDDSVFVTVSLRQVVARTFMVYDADTREPLSGAYVRTAGGEIPCDSQGSAVVNVVPGSSLLFEVWANGYDTLVFEGRYAAAALFADSLPLHRQRGFCKGTVACQGQVQHAGTVVLLSTGERDTTDASGTFMFENVRAGAYMMNASREGFAPWTDTVDIPGRDTGTVTATLVIMAGTIVTNVVWDADGVPYSIDGPLTVVDNGSLEVQPGVEIKMKSGAQLSTDGNGLIVISGTGWNFVRISADSAGGALARMEIRGAIGTTPLQYTYVKDVAVSFVNGPQVHHCLFVYTGNYAGDTGVSIDASDYSTVFNQCDFIQNGADVPAAFIGDSLYTGGEEGGSVTFSNSIFSQTAPPAVTVPVLTSSNTGNVMVYVKNCNVYTNGNRPEPLFDIVHIDTSSVGQKPPDFNNADQDDYYLKQESVLLDKSDAHGFIGALGVVESHREAVEP